MSHIFYRHASRASTQGAKGFFDEFRGVTTLDRVQEKEADILGARVACQADFDPQGVIILVRVFVALDPSASNFTKNHPSGIERLQYLQTEAAKCQSIQIQQQRPPEPTGGNVQAEAGTVWKLVGEISTSNWTFEQYGETLHGEQLLPSQRQQLGDYSKIDVTNAEGVYRGIQTVQTTYKVADASPQGFYYKACHWDYGVELTSVTPDRIEGRWEGYREPRANPLTCLRSGERIWKEVLWVRQ